LIAGDNKTVEGLGALSNQHLLTMTGVVPVTNAPRRIACVLGMRGPGQSGLGRVTAVQHNVHGWPYPPIRMSIVKLEGGGSVALPQSAMAVREARRGRR
jgi:hypothetical protein